MPPTVTAVPHNTLTSLRSTGARRASGIGSEVAPIDGDFHAGLERGVDARLIGDDAIDVDLRCLLCCAYCKGNGGEKNHTSHSEI